MVPLSIDCEGEIGIESFMAGDFFASYRPFGDRVRWHPGFPGGFSGFFFPAGPSEKSLG
jgi:hypothetical protein